MKKISLTSEYEEDLMNLSAFKNPLVIVAVIGAGMFGGVGTYVGMDCSQAREQRARQEAEDAALKRLMTPGPKVDPKKYEKEYEENPFFFDPSKWDRTNQ